MAAARYRERVTVQQYTLTADAYGGQSRSQVAVVTNRAAQIRPVRAGERFLASAGQEVAERSHLVRLRYSSDVAAISAKMRVLWGARVLEIEGVERDERKRELMLTCREVDQ